MTADELAAALATDFANPGALKSGEYLAELVLDRIRHVLPESRGAVVELMQSWLASRSEPRTMLAVTVASTFGLDELRGELLRLLQDIQAGRSFPGFYADPVESAIGELSP